MIVALTGVDGSGKTTFAKRAASILQQEGQRTKYFYLGEYFFLQHLVRFLHSLKKDTSEGKNPFLGTNNKPLLLKFWVLLATVDNFFWYMCLLIYSLSGTIVICDRYFYDRLIGFEYHGYSNKILSWLFYKLTPRPDLLLVLDTSEEISQQRELKGKHSLSFYKDLRKKYSKMASYCNATVINTERMGKKRILKEVLKVIKSVAPTKKEESLIALFIFILLSLVSLTWFKGDNLIGHGDHFKAVDFYRYLKTLSSSWDGMLNVGSPEFSLEHHLPYSFFYLVLGYLGFGPVVLEKTWLFLSLFLPSVFMYKFLTRFLGQRIPFPIRVVGALFYIFNPLLILYPIGISIAKFPVYAFLPLLAFFMVALFESTSWRDKIRCGIFFTLTTTLMSASFGNVAEVAPAGIVLFFLFVYEFLLHKEKQKHILLILGIIVLSFLLNFWWIYSSFYNQFLVRSEFSQAMGEFNPNTKIFDAFRLLGSWALRSGYRGAPYYPFGGFYYSTKGMLVTYMITATAFFPLLFLSFFSSYLRRGDRLKVFLFIFLGLLGIFLVKGGSLPFGQWYIDLYKSVSFFKMFRESYSKFSLISLFSFCVLICAGLYFVVLLVDQYAKKYSKVAPLIISIIFGVLIMAASFPLFNGQVVYTQANGVMKQAIVKVPEYWQELYDFSSDFTFLGRVLILPNSGYYGSSYIWEKGYTGRPAELYLNAPKVYFRRIPPLSKGDLVISGLYSSIDAYTATGEEKYLVGFVNLARILNVNYFLQQNDFDWRNISFENKENWSVESLDNFFDSNPNILNEIKSFGEFTPTYLKSIPYIAGGESVFRIEGDPTEDVYLGELSGRKVLRLYALNNTLTLPKFYIPNIMKAYENLDAFSTFTLMPEFIETKPLFVMGPPLQVTNFDTNIDVSYERLSDARYRIFFSKPIREKTLLVFSETFDKNWHLAKSCNFFFCSGKASSEHFVANHYANGWVVDPSNEILGLNSIYVVHTSDTRLKVGIFVSSISLVFCGVLLIRLNTKGGFIKLK